MYYEALLIHGLIRAGPMKQWVVIEHTSHSNSISQIDEWPERQRSKGEGLVYPLVKKASNSISLPCV